MGSFTLILFCSQITICFTSENVLLHRYSFNDRIGTDSIGGSVWNAQLKGGSSISNGRLVLHSDGRAYAELPKDIFQSYSSFSIEIWVTTTPNHRSASIIDFGEPSKTLMILRDPNSRMLGTFLYDKSVPCSVEIGSNEYVDNLEDAHLVITYSYPGNVTFYKNGVFKGSVVSCTLPNFIKNYIGRSTYDAPSIVGSIDEIRLWGGILSETSVNNHFLLGPNIIPDKSLRIKLSRVPISLPATQSIMLTSPPGLSRVCELEVQSRGSFYVDRTYVKFLSNSKDFTNILKDESGNGIGDGWNIVKVNNDCSLVPLALHVNIYDELAHHISTSDKIAKVIHSLSDGDYVMVAVQKSGDYAQKLSITAKSALQSIGCGYSIFPDKYSYAFIGRKVGRKGTKGITICDKRPSKDVIYCTGVITFGTA